MSAHLTTWIVEHGSLAVFALLAVDAVLPAGGELVMLFAGALAAVAALIATAPLRPRLRPLFPVSSLGHSVIVPALLGWDIHQSDKYFLTFLVATHLATALVLLGFFWRDWVRIVRGLGRSVRAREVTEGDADAVLGWWLVIGTIPAGLLGLTLEHPLRRVFASPTAAALCLVGSGLSAVRRRALAAGRSHPPGPAHGDERIAHELGARSALGIGAAAALKLPDLLGSAGDGARGPALAGSLCAALTAYLSVRLLVRFFETNSC